MNRIGTRTTQVELLLRDVPCLLRHLRHLLHDAELLVEHQQGVVAVGNATDNLGTDSHLIVLEGEELHLRGALLRQDVSEKIDRP